jgi:hypothetical protein
MSLCFWRSPVWKYQVLIQSLFSRTVENLCQMHLLI